MIRIGIKRTLPVVRLCSTLSLFLTENSHRNNIIESSQWYLCIGKMISFFFFFIYLFFYSYFDFRRLFSLPLFIYFPLHPLFSMHYFLLLLVDLFLLSTFLIINIIVFLLLVHFAFFYTTVLVAIVLLSAYFVFSSSLSSSSPSRPLPPLSVYQMIYNCNLYVSRPGTFPPKQPTLKSFPLSFMLRQIYETHGVQI